MPLLSVAADVSLQRVTGRAPAGSTVHLVTYNAFGPQSPVGPTPQWIQDVVADLQGDYYWDIPVNPGDYVQASIVSRSGVSFETMAVVPAIDSYPRSDRVRRGVTAPHSLHHHASVFTPDDPDGCRRGDDRPWRHPGQSALYAWRSALVGSPAIVSLWRRGPTLVIGPSRVSRPRSTSSRQPCTERAPANHTLTIRSYYDASSVSGQSDGTGHYRIPLPAGVYPGTGLYVTLHTAQGDRLTLMAGVSNWKVDINSPCVEFSTSRLVSSGVVTLADFRDTFERPRTSWVTINRCGRCAFLAGPT